MCAGVLRRTPLAACLALALALAQETSATAAPLLDGAGVRGVPAVSNCNDAGPGSLRAAAEAAVSGDVIDLTALACSTITLTSGEIAASADDLTLQGPGLSQLTIDAQYASRNLVHLGSGTLTIAGMTLTGGAKYATGTDAAKGGCIFSNGSVELDDARAKYCRASAESGDAIGGAIFASSGISLRNSSIDHSSAHAASGAGAARGGGVYTQGVFSMIGSTLSANSASSYSQTGVGGAAFIGGDATLIASTLSGNRADTIAGLLHADKYATHVLRIENSTLANNASYHSLGSALYATGPTQISGSTISGNTERNAGAARGGAGLRVRSGVTLDLRSTIVSGNHLVDGATSQASDIAGGGSLGGANNLIGLSLLAVPPQTIIDTDPHLGVLRFNGGPTQTMMPSLDSPGIDSGNNAAGNPWDQRGPGYARVVGIVADMGAVEADTLFVDGFDPG
jgi:hypothetical protein